MIILFSVVLGYLIGAIPFALVIGKLFYRTDIREFGSGNLGGGNASRVLGKKAGLAVMTLDLLKVSLVVGIVRLWGGGDAAVACGGVAAGIGHCFPVFAEFHGGKAVAAMYGFLFGLSVFAGRSLLLFLLPLLVFLLVLILTGIISLSSMISAAVITLYVWIRPETLPVRLALLFFLAVIVIRHRANIGRMLRREENTVAFREKLFRR